LQREILVVAVKWLRQHWKAVVIGTALFFVGVGTGAAGSSGTAEPAPEPEPAATTKRVYKGNGSKTVTIRTSGGKLRWTNDGDLFQLWTGDFSVFVNSQAHSGNTEVPSGRHKLTVNAIGNWTIRVPS
jgi:hypothetical protein